MSGWPEMTITEDAVKRRPLSSPSAVDSRARGMQRHCCLTAGIILTKRGLLGNNKKTTLKNNV